MFRVEHLETPATCAMLEHVAHDKAGAQRVGGAVTLAAGEIVLIRSCSITDKDYMYGNEELCRQPFTQLSHVSHVMPVFGLPRQFSGSGLDVKWLVAK